MTYHKKTDDPGSWSDVIRRAAQADGRQQVELCRLAGLTKAQISRFMAGRRGLSLDNAGRLAEVVGVQIVHQRPAAASQE